MPSRPLRQSQFHQSDWYPEPPVHLPTPSGLRAARAAAKTASETILDSDMGGQHKIPHAQQMQARALAAQAAHQLRVGHPTITSGHSRIASNTAFTDIDGSNHLKEDMDFPTFPSLNKPLDDLIDEIQVDLSLSLVEEEYHPFTSPTASVDISAWLPAPGPPVLVASEANLAASAVPLTEWAAEFCWHLGSRLITPSLNYVEIMHPCHASRAHQLDATFISFKLDVKQALSATLTSPQGLFLGLYYISRLPIGQLAHQSIHHSPNHNTSALSVEEASFRTTLYGDSFQAPTPTDVVPRSVFALALMLSNKWLEDNTFTIKTWHDVTGIPSSRLKSLEVAALRILEFSLAISARDWQHWLELLRRHTASIVAKEPIGDRWSVNALALSKLDAVIRQSPLVDLVPSDHPSLLSPSELSSPNDIGSKDCEGWTPFAQTSNLPTPSKWGNMQLDTPVAARPPYARYEPVQRSRNFGLFGEFDIYSDIAVQAAYPYDRHQYSLHLGAAMDLPGPQPKTRCDLPNFQPFFDYHYPTLPQISHNHLTIFPGNTEPDLRLWPHPGRLLLPSYT